ncbi:MAG: HDOD domain-containing protein, partial [Deltaproteobacteria bacterium]|nr:HDOD domain-containing protein [Deltaproteobacteria bacterium]
DEEVEAACKKLKEAGYMLALDDFADHEDYASLLSMADVIKVDFLTTGVEERKSLVERYGSRDIKMLAEKVETRDEFKQALELGYSYFQGYFFSKPVIISGKDIPAFKLNYLRLLQEVSRPDFSFDRVEDIIKSEVSLSNKLLKYLNSAFFGFRTEIRSIRQALTLLGEVEARKWISLTALAGMSEDKPGELIRMAIIRAKFCELLACEVGFNNRKSDLFLLGVFSMVDAIMDRSAGEIVEEISLAEDVKDALLGEENRLRKIFNLVVAYEKGEWETVADLSAGFKIDEDVSPGLYLNSIAWAEQIFSVKV